MNAVATTNPAEAFRAVAADRFHSAADMTLHELVDEFQRLAKVIHDGTTEQDQDGLYSTTRTPEAEIAVREQQIINGAARARFAISFSTHDLDF
jgi:hypothetical protein